MRKFIISQPVDESRNMRRKKTTGKKLFYFFFRYQHLIWKKHAQTSPQHEQKKKIQRWQKIFTLSFIALMSFKYENDIIYNHLEYIVTKKK